MDGILPVEEFMEEEFLALQNEHKVVFFLFFIFKHMSCRFKHSEINSLSANYQDGLVGEKAWTTTWS